MEASVLNEDNSACGKQLKWGTIKSFNRFRVFLSVEEQMTVKAEA